MKPAIDLESLIRHLAGRTDSTARSRAQPDDLFGQLLADPTSDISQFLDEIRRKTRALLEEPAETDRPLPLQPARGSPDPGLPRPKQFKRVPLPWVILLVVSSLAAGAMRGLIWKSREQPATDRAVVQTERILTEIRRVAAEVRTNRGNPPPAIPLADIGSLGASIAALDARLDTLVRSLPENQPAAVAPNLAVPLVRAPGPAASEAGPAPPGLDVVAIRRELASSEAALTRQIQEMRTVLQELNTVVRRVLSRPQASEANNSTMPLLGLALQALIHNLQHPSAQVRMEAVERLVQLGAPARSAIPALQQRMAQESDSNVRMAIDLAIGVLAPR